MVYASLKLDMVYGALLRSSKHITPVNAWLNKHFQDIIAGKYIVFIHHIDRLYDVLEYINRNEVGRTVYIVHCNNANAKQYEKSYKEIKEALPHLQKAGVFDHFKLHLLYRNEPFGPEVIDKVSNELKIRKNRVLIGSIHSTHPFDYENLGGVRIIF
jgi:hypothetical protein